MGFLYPGKSNGGIFLHSEVEVVIKRIVMSTKIHVSCVMSISGTRATEIRICFNNSV